MAATNPGDRRSRYLRAFVATTIILVLVGGGNVVLLLLGKLGTGTVGAFLVITTLDVIAMVVLATRIKHDR